MLLFQDAKTLNLSNQILNVKKLIKSKTGTSLDDYMNESETIIRSLEKNLLKPILSPNAEKEKSTISPTTSQQPRQDPLIVPSRNDTRRQHDPLRDIGRGDLDPFGGRGGGMLFQPPGIGGIGGPVRPHFG